MKNNMWKALVMLNHNAILKVKYIKDSKLNKLVQHPKYFSKMSEAKLNAIPEVDIDNGIFKYVLVKVWGKEKSSGSEISKTVVRGYKDCQWHSDIYDRLSASCQGLGLDTECLGGGRIEHNPSNKYIKIYGYSQGFGKADHEVSRNILLTHYPSYKIDISDEGY